MRSRRCRSPEEVSAWKTRDPILALGRVLRADYGIPDEEIAAAEAQAHAAVAEALRAALDDPFPEPGSIDEGVYA